MAEPTLLQLATDRVGQLRAGRVLAFMIAWQTARRALGDEWPAEGVEAQVRAYSAWWRQSERNGWRELDRFRQVWPDETTPSALMDAAASSWDERRGVQGLGAVVVAG